MTKESAPVADFQVLEQPLPVALLAPRVVVVNREQHWFPFPKTVTTEYAFTDGQLAAEFERMQKANDNLRRSLKETTTALNLQKNSIDGQKDTIQQLGAELKKASTVKTALATLQTKHKQLSERHRRTTSDFSKEKQTTARLRIENTASLNKIRSLQNDKDSLAATLEKTRHTHTKQLNAAEHALLGADERIASAELVANQRATVLEMIPKVNRIPFGVERLLHRMGVDVGPMVDLPSFPPLAGPEVPFVRPNLRSDRYTLEALCLSKERTNASKSQDAMAFREVDDELIVTLADGVSRSHRQSEWAHRIVRAGLALNPLAAIESAQLVHQEHERTLLELTPPAERWMAEASLGKPSHATLMRVHCRRDGTVRLQRCGDGWAAAFTDGVWSVIMTPSSVTGTNAAVSNQPFNFDDEVIVERPERLMIMTDGLNPTDQKGLIPVHDALVCDKEGSMAEFIQHQDDANLFDDDDVTIVLFNFGGENGSL